MTPVVAIDTNVVVAGLLTSRADSPVVQILDDMLAAAFPFAVSEALLAEYRDVLNRPALGKVHGLDRNEVEALVVSLAQYAVVLTPVPTTSAPDPGDQHVWELLAAMDGLRLVTGDKLLLKAPAKAELTMTPAAFVELWKQDVQG